MEVKSSCAPKLELFSTTFYKITIIFTHFLFGFGSWQLSRGKKSFELQKIGMLVTNMPKYSVLWGSMKPFNGWRQVIFLMRIFFLNFEKKSCNMNLFW